jgi:hypothetical protein
MVQKLVWTHLGRFPFFKGCHPHPDAVCPAGDGFKQLVHHVAKTILESHLGHDLLPLRTSYLDVHRPTFLNEKSDVPIGRSLDGRFAKGSSTSTNKQQHCHPPNTTGRIARHHVIDFTRCLIRKSSVRLELHELGFLFYFIGFYLHEERSGPAQSLHSFPPPQLDLDVRSRTPPHVRSHQQSQSPSPFCGIIYNILH